MIYDLFQNSVCKVVKITNTLNLKSAVKSQSITTVNATEFSKYGFFWENVNGKKGVSQLFVQLEKD